MPSEEVVITFWLDMTAPMSLLSRVGGADAHPRVPREVNQGSHQGAQSRRRCHQASFAGVHAAYVRTGVARLSSRRCIRVIELSRAEKVPSTALAVSTDYQNPPIHEERCRVARAFGDEGRAERNDPSAESRTSAEDRTRQ